jgi:hypothetical protein
LRALSKKPNAGCESKWRNPPAQLQAGPNQEPESKGESDWPRTQESGSKVESDWLWTQKPEAKDGARFFGPRYPGRGPMDPEARSKSKGALCVHFLACSSLSSCLTRRASLRSTADSATPGADVELKPTVVALPAVVHSTDKAAPGSVLRGGWCGSSTHVAASPERLRVLL